MSFPQNRPRRLRRTPLLREMLRETTLDARDLVASMPGVVQHTLDSLRKEGATLREAGVPAVIVFGIPSDKDAQGSQAAAESGISQQGLRALREELGDDIVLLADLC